MTPDADQLFESVNEIESDLERALEELQKEAPDFEGVKIFTLSAGSLLQRLIETTPNLRAVYAQANAAIK